MRLLSFSEGGKEGWGAVSGEDIVDLSRALPNYPTLADFIASSDFARRDAIVAAQRPGPKLSDVSFLPVIPRPEKIVCAVRNYLDHHNESLASGIQREITGYPPIFLRVWRSQVGHNQPIVRPKVSLDLDWEGELAVIIGKSGRHISRADAWSHIAGYSIFNDVSVRDWQRHAQQIASGKNFVGTGPFGPWLVTPDEIGDPSKLKIETRVNGAVMQSANTSLLIFPIPHLIEYCSTIFDLVPGDVIVTGTPAGVGAARKPPVFLKPGDLVDVQIENIGTLSNPVAQETDG
ncbi:2-keto-4-pentenoate hydratase/2-oxohepta-3-ene-1,7-dioic acid hydratase in catechol pathway [Bradyrhizobium macuxiense]|uniref:2-keto-4-pentenoate hydratase/2-oxohepta-3-ene-1,7-dioic acid hydratase in catechol pathway n=1 Tax=Bradyrhizobium macuxiense TaxID=1755647 RepID=A0A560KX38_9BRAD|nr:fumarylacetoacetate hydrolase family protein [Bradyrhizobium macuxiense]TWB87785.1 2-keto-4-pentenoate hydratase/2-oxohepta-3-ene-1,7-dioic acid hydratase in catechol pathway [Bradyrhizobium macuxiense]